MNKGPDVTTSGPCFAEWQLAVGDLRSLGWIHPLLRFVRLYIIAIVALEVIRPVRKPRQWEGNVIK